jgi:DNA-binding response OmpR family regulator
MADKKLLLIDDDTELCEELAEVFKEEGFPTQYTPDPVEGINIIKNGNFHAVILDYKMKQLTGIDVLSMLKQAGQKPKVLMISGRPFIENLVKEHGLQDMVIGVLSKPVDIGVLLKKIKSIQ